MDPVLLNLWNCLIYQRVDVHGIYILVINKMEQVVQTVASTIDNVEAISREMVGKNVPMIIPITTQNAMMNGIKRLVLFLLMFITILFY